MQKLPAPVAMRLRVARTQTEHYEWARQYWRLQGGKHLDFKRYRYLKPLYEDRHPDQVYKKAGQIGFSELMLSLSFFVADKMGKSVGYFFPATSQLGDFVRMRVDPAIHFSEYLREKTARGGVDGRQKVSDNLGLKNVGDGFVLFRGAQTDTQMTSVALDMAIMDELDRFGDFSVPMIDKRLINSDLHWRRMASTPTLDGRGIDLEIQDTDQHEWHIVCPQCKRDQVLDYWANVDEKNLVVLCAHCKAPWSAEAIQAGTWVPKYPERKRRGYIASGLLSPTLQMVIPGKNKTRLQEIVENMNSNNMFVLEQAYNQDLGLTYKAANAGMTDEMLDACRRDYMLPFSLAAVSKPYAGVDVGRTSYLVVMQDDQKSGKPKVLLATELKELETDLDYWLEYFDILSLVIDAEPETNLVTRLTNKYAGRLFSCHYDYHRPVDGKFVRWYDGYAVTAHRTASMDEVYGRIRSQDIELPSNIRTVKGFYDHFKNQQRVVGVRHGMTVYVYEDNGKPDHYAHAMNYALIAREKVPADLDPDIGLRHSRKQGRATDDSDLDDVDDEDDLGGIHWAVNDAPMGFNKKVF